MDHAVPMCVLQAHGHGPHQPHDFGHRALAVGVDAVLERSALEELHREERGNVVDVVVEQLAEALVVEPLDGLDLDPESIEDLARARGGFERHFQRDLAVEPVVPGPEYLAHAAAADPGEQVVADRPIELRRTEGGRGLERLTAGGADAPHPEPGALDLEITAASGIRTARAEQHRVATWAKGPGRARRPRSRSPRDSREKARHLQRSVWKKGLQGVGEDRVMRLQGKTAVVTGSGRGIGRAIAVRLAREGADVVINDLDVSSSARETLAAVEAVGRRGVLIQADVSRTDDARRLIDDAVRQLGLLDILVNNAGIEKHSPFVEVTEADYDKVLDVNLKGTFFVTQAFVRYLLAAGRPGRVINISSVHEEMPFPGFSTYCASKGGMQLLTRDLAVELGQYGITVNGIAPGAIATEINRSLLDDEARVERLLKQIPLGRMGEPEDVAAVAAFLASSDADYVTGSTYYVDGGLAWDYRE